MLQETVGVLSDPESRAAILALETASRRVASYKTRAVSSRSELVIVPWGLVKDTKLATISGGARKLQDQILTSSGRVKPHASRP